jgi:hypothetical protein
MNSRDQSGYVVFSGGDIGAAHVMAHELLDTGAIALGRERLGQWLTGREGAGSDWAHIQFHMAVFELEAGDWDAAYARFLKEVMPIAAASEDALTDAPALAWRLALRAEADKTPGRGQGPALPWAPLRRTALGALEREAEPFVELHNLLALAGAGDAGGLDGWLRHRRGKGESSDTVIQMGEALRDVTLRHHRRAADRLREVVPEIPAIGGSGAQNALFAELGNRLAA